jgi:hypothetical protein
MPYFQRKPIEQLVDTVRSNVSIPGLPSRGSLPVTRAITDTGLASPAAITGIVEQAAAVLASERPSGSGGYSAGSGAGSVAPTQSTQISQLQGQVNALIEQLVALLGRPSGLDIAAPQYTTLAAQEPRSDAAHVIVEPAPVLSPAGPVAPGGTAQISIALVNEDEQPAQIGFLSTGLIGEAGEQIPAERISFQPRELTLSPGKTGEVVVRVVVPTPTPCGVYSGLIRASRLDYLHAVLVVQVDYGST